MVHSNGSFCGQLCWRRVLQGVHNLSLHCPLLHLVFFCTAVRRFWNELSVYKLERNKREEDVTNVNTFIFKGDTETKLTSVVSTLTGSAYFSVAAPSGGGEPTCSVSERNLFHTNCLMADLLLVTRFRWLLPSLGFSQRSLLLGLGLLLARPILMSLRSVKVATQQHFVQSFLQ